MKQGPTCKNAENVDWLEIRKVKNLLIHQYFVDSTIFAGKWGWGNEVCDFALAPLSSHTLILEKVQFVLAVHSSNAAVCKTQEHV